ncbi:MAG TPA: hypothetical protein VKB51_08050 [bacterium]|nr:hypothetical protein [bacterium]
MIRETMHLWRLRCAMVVALTSALATLLLVACAAQPEPQPPRPLAGNWWSDGSYRVKRLDPASVKQFWYDQRGELELLPVTELHAMLPETLAGLDANCRAEGGPESFWMGWAMRSGNPFPAHGVCYRGRAMTISEVTTACARLQSRGRTLIIAWHRPDERTYACREP